MPLADRVEWAVFSLLSTAGPISETAFFERVASLFSGHDMPDDGLVRACLESYRSLASTPERMLTADDLLRRSQDHTDLLATIADAGHRLKMRVWIGRREQTRRVGEGTLGDLLDDGREAAHLGIISPAVDELAEVDCIWYVRGKVGFLFEVEWTAMLGEPLLRKHARIPPDDAADPLPGDRPGTGRARPLQARSLAAPAGCPRRRHVAHHQVGPPPGVPRSANRSTWPTSSHTSGSTRRSSGRRSRWRCSVAASGVA